MKKEMLINVLQAEECRIAILEDGVLEELYVERTSQESYVGNIYKGRIVNIEPSIQAAFVDFGIGRNGFLHVSDVEPAYYRHLESRHPDDGGRGRDRGRGGDSGRGDRERGRGRGGDRGRSRSRSGPRTPPAELEQDLAELLGDDPVPPVPEELLDQSFPQPAPQVPEEEATPDREQPRRQGRSRRRHRNGGRRGAGREDSAEPGGQDSSAASSSEFSPPPSDAPPVSPEHRPADVDDPPQYMGSAERRTEAGVPERDPFEGGSGIKDEALYYPGALDAPASNHLEQDQGPNSHGSTGADESDDEFAPTFASREAGAPSYPDEIMPNDLALDEGDRPEGSRDEGEGDVDDEGSGARRPQRDRRGGGRPFRRPQGRSPMGRPKPLIQDIFRRGQEVLVQVIKEGIGTKGPTLSTYISIAGRYLVLMPGLNRVGVSRKIADDEQRRRLREIFHELQPPRGLGFIIRTAGIDKTKKELQRDLAYLSRLWQVMVRRIKKIKAPAEIYQESDMITRTIRDTFTNDIDTIYVDEATAYEHAKEFLQIVMPRYASRIRLYSDSEPLFHRYGIEEEIARIQRRHVPLPDGGSIVIDQTEALVAIDVNSGNFRADNNAEETAYRMNLRAAKEIARQLRLRDLGGVIVNDFIDMREEKHRRDVERALRDAIKRDRARTKLLKISAFGIIEMTRQRIRPSLKRSVYQECPYCHGTSHVKTCESMSIDVMRMIQLAAHRQGIQRIQIRVQEDVANYLLNRKRKEITRLEESGNIQVSITSAIGVSPEMLEFSCYDPNNAEVKSLHYEDQRGNRR